MLTQLKGDDNYGIRITVVCNHEVFIATAGTNGESSSIVCEHFDNVLYADVEFPRRFAWWSYSQRYGLTIN